MSYNKYYLVIRLQRTYTEFFVSQAVAPQIAYLIIFEMQDLSPCTSGQFIIPKYKSIYNTI